MLWCKFIMTISAHFNVLEAQMQRKYAEEHFHAFSAQNKLFFLPPLRNVCVFGAIQI